MAATVMETSTARGAATFSGMQKASRGTASSASPKPKAERMSVAMKMTDTTWSVVTSIGISGKSFSHDRRLWLRASWRGSGRSLRDSECQQSAYPALKRWAKIERPSGTWVAAGCGCVTGCGCGTERVGLEIVSLGHAFVWDTRSYGRAYVSG